MTHYEVIARSPMGDVAISPTMRLLRYARNDTANVNHPYFFFARRAVTTASGVTGSFSKRTPVAS